MVAVAFLNSEPLNSEPALKAAMGKNYKDANSNADQCEETPFVSDV